MDSKRPSVADIMTIDPVVLDADASLEEADLVLRTTFLSGIPVVDRDGRLVGIVTHAHLVAYRFGLANFIRPKAEPVPRRRSDDPAEGHDRR